MEELAYLYCEDIIDEEEFALLYDANRKRNLYIPHQTFQKFDLEMISDDECLNFFRFYKDDINRLTTAFQLPDKIVCANRTVVSSVEGLCVLLRRLSYPCRYSDMVPGFGRSISELCYITNKMVDILHNKYGHLLTSFEQAWLDPCMLKRYADAIHDKGAALDNCWGFIDGTVRPICRPQMNQKTVYNGHKRVHALKFQSVVASNGLIANLYGPVGKLYIVYILFFVCTVYCI